MLFLSKICLPTVDDDLNILLNDRLYHFYLALLEAVIVNLRYFWFHIVLCFMTVLFNMNMDRFMVIAIELEDKSKKDEYCWHDRRCFYSLFAKLRLFLEPTKNNAGILHRRGLIRFLQNYVFPLKFPKEQATDWLAISLDSTLVYLFLARLQWAVVVGLATVETGAICIVTADELSDCTDA